MGLKDENGTFEFIFIISNPESTSGVNVRQQAATAADPLVLTSRCSLGPVPVSVLAQTGVRRRVPPRNY